LLKRDQGTNIFAPSFRLFLSNMIILRELLRKHLPRISRSQGYSTKASAVPGNRSLVEYVKRSARQHVFLTNLGMASGMMTVCDINAQILDGTFWDRPRSSLFFTFGLFNGAVFFYAAYARFLPWLFPHSVAFANKPLALKRLDTVGQVSVFQ